MKYWLKSFGRRLPLDRLDVPLMAAAAVALYLLGVPFKAALIVWVICVVVIVIWATGFRKRRRELEAEIEERKSESLLARLAARRRAGRRHR